MLRAVMACLGAAGLCAAGHSVVSGFAGPSVVSGFSRTGAVVSGFSRTLRIEPAHQITSAVIPSPRDIDARDVLNKYCVTCHNARMKTAGLLLDTLDPGNVGPDAEQWEKVSIKLR